MINNKKALLLILLLLVLSSCSPYPSSGISPHTTIKQNMFIKNNKNANIYFDENLNTLDEIEGIWSFQNVSLFQSDFRIAITKDTTNNGYDYVGIYLDDVPSSLYNGKTKAIFRKTAYEDVYEMTLYMLNINSRSGTSIDIVRIDDNGFIRYLNPGQDKYNKDFYALKQYPTSSLQLIDVQINEKHLKATGSGFLFKENGIIITNYHIIENAQYIELLFPSANLKFSGEIILKDVNNDLAIIQISDFNISLISNFTVPFSVGDINSVKTGQEVFTLGFPLGSIMGTKPRLSSGRINSLYGLEEDPRLLQIGNPLQPGNSGGPLFNENGELVGIVVSGLNAEYFYENLGIIPQNVNFAVKVSYLESLIGMLPDEEIISKRENLLYGKKMEEQIELLNPFIVQIRSY